jgi:type II secretory pathway pseudopilin PulG
MNHLFYQMNHQKGSTLIESILAMSVLAVAIPLVFGSFAASDQSKLTSEVETVSAWIVPAAIQELHAVREDRSELFKLDKLEEPFPPVGKVWVIAFNSDGKLIGRMSEDLYVHGTQTLEGQSVYYLVSIKQKMTNDIPRLQLWVEYPAAASSASRKHLEFYSAMP